MTSLASFDRPSLAHWLDGPERILLPRISLGSLLLV
jgi:hypothetical protein